MADNVKKLQQQFHVDKRKHYFGTTIESITIDGIRGIENMKIQCEFPVIAFCGLNGSGKSTLIQAISCAYKNPVNKIYRYHMKDFFYIGKLDEKPFTENAKVVFKYDLKDSELTQTTTVKRKSRKTSWEGYKRQPNKNVYYFGISSILPRSENKSFLTHYRNAIEITKEKQLDKSITENISKILGIKYDSAIELSTKYKNQESYVGKLNKGKIEYSEIHMGFGEMRIYYIIKLLETIPDCSLICIDEPELSLHPSAQHRLGIYLLDVTSRKHHQIFFTTHSSMILNALPEETRYLIYFDGNKRNIVGRISSSYINSFLTEHHQSALIIYVEDDVSEKILRLITTESKTLDYKINMNSVNIVPVGNADTVKLMVKNSNSARLNSIGILDADQSPDKNNNIFILPGASAPEKEIISNESVIIHLMETYSIDVNAFEAKNPDYDHHSLFYLLNMEAGQLDEELIKHDIIQVYTRSLPTSDKKSVLNIIRDSI